MSSVITAAGLFLLITYITMNTTQNAIADSSTTRYPVADTYINSSVPSSNFGSANPLTASSSVRRTLMKFDSRLPAGSKVTSALLKVYAKTSSTGGFEIHPEGDSWQENTVTWNNQPAWNTTILATSSQPVSGTWLSIPLPINSININGNTNFGIRYSVSGINVAMSSREDAMYKPQLVIAYSTSTIYTPNPSQTYFPTPTPTTAPSSADVIIAAAGDIVNTCTGTSCGYYKVSDVILNLKPNAVLALGDISNNSGALTDYTGPFGHSWGRFKSIIKPVPGNHDYGAITNYFNYFGSAAHGPNGYYSFNLGNWHIVAINSNCAKVGGCAVGSPQEKWLKADLAANSKPCTLAFFHHPRFSSGYGGNFTNTSALIQDLYNAGAEIVLSGHSHDYERFAPQNNSGQADTARGITQFVVGTGGSGFTGFSTIKPNSRVRQNTTYGALKLTLHANSYDWRFIPVAGRTWTDTGSASCH